MKNERKPPKIVFTVLLVNGQTKTHVYDSPTEPKEAKKFIEQMAELIALALSRGTETFLPFQNPSISYNPDNVLGVEFNAVETEKFEEAIRKAQRKTMGFTKPKAG